MDLRFHIVQNINYSNSMDVPWNIAKTNSLYGLE